MFARAATRAVSVTGRQVPRRGFVAPPEISTAEQAHASSTASLWKNVSLAGIVGVAGFGVYVLSGAHHEPAEIPKYEYIGIAHKPFPWKDGETGLFEVKHH